jgi:hypothetical protein
MAGMTSYRCQDNIKVDLNEQVVRMWIGYF